jgi:hypothetical protein
MEMDETWGYHYQEVVLQGYISDFVWVGLVRELGGLENGPTTHSWRIPGLGIYPYNVLYQIFSGKLLFKVRGRG